MLLKARAEACCALLDGSLVDLAAVTSETAAQPLCPWLTPFAGAVTHCARLKRS